MKHNFLSFRAVMMAFLLMMGMTAFAQVAVQGTVTDVATGDPIIGASVLEIGTTNGTITDFDGNFSLMVQPGAKLSISYMGYKTQELDATPMMVVKMGEDNELLEEVVVVGYGVVKKNDATGSVTAIKPDEMNKGLVLNAQDMLAGKIAGVAVTSNGGEPGAGSNIRIRGGSSLSASNDPLIVIDGVLMDNNGLYGINNPLSMVNPSDIETFTVLKDASATAIYGSRASNGVIIITTKKGASGSKPKFTYDGNVSAGVITNRLQVMTADQYRTFLTDNAKAYGNIAAGLGPLTGTGTDWQKEVTRVGIGTDHNFSVVGGTKHMPYRASLGYTYQDGTIKKSNMQRVTAAVTLNPTFLDKHLSFNFNAKGMYISNNKVGDGSIIGAALAMDPTRPVNSDAHLLEYGPYYQTEKPWDPDDQGRYTDTEWRYTINSNVPQNPVATLETKEYGAKAGVFIGNLEADYKIHGFEDLRLHANFAADYNYGEEKTDIAPQSASNNYYGWKGKNQRHNYNLQFNCYAQYYKDFNDKHHFDAQVGYEWSHLKNWGVQDGNGLFPMTYNDAELGTSNAGQIYNPYHYEWATESYLVSFFGRVNYIALNRYMITATVRGDGSSRFAPGRQWGVFPAVALGWKMKEESWLKDVNWLSELKLRLGFGITGQQEINQGDYPGLVLYSISREHASYTLGEKDANGNYKYYQSYRPEAFNTELTWEKTTTYNAGIDYGFLNGRISGSIDYYYRITKDLISVVDVAAGMNFKNQVVSNIGSLSNQGVEFSINAVAIDNKKLKWDLGFNFTYNQNKIIKLTTGKTADPNNPYFVETGGISAGTGNTIQRHQEGLPAATFFVYQTYLSEDGYYEIVNQNGDKDASGKDIIDDKDLIAYHNAMAPFTLGLQSKWQFYNFDLGITLRSSIGNYVYNDVRAGRMNSLQTPLREGGYTNILCGTETEFARISGSNTVGVSSNAYKMDIWVENASFLRIDNITLGYTWNKPAIKARLYGSVSNPLVISGYKGLDPEVFGGIDNNIYPRSLTALVGVNLQF